ncbi:hypothetical protein DSUL_50302 [Desulfovibrionales bacterium]
MQAAGWCYLDFFVRLDLLYLFVLIDVCVFFSICLVTISMDFLLATLAKL